MDHKRLNNYDFIALRSLSKERWVLGGYVLWKINKRWRPIQIKGFYRPDECYSRFDLGKKAYDALGRLEELGLVREYTIPCCPNPDCYRNERRAYEPNERGLALLAKVYPKSKQSNCNLTIVDALANEMFKNNANQENKKTHIDDAPKIKTNNWLRSFFSRLIS